jgi:hypothetical protein
MDRRRSRFVCFVSLALVAIVMASCGGDAGAWMLLVGSVMWAYVSGVALLMIAILARLSGRPAPALPFGRRRLDGGRLLAVAACVVAFSIAREMGVIHVSAFHSHASAQTLSSSGGQSNGRAPRMAGRPVDCMTSIDASDAAGEAFEDALGCSVSGAGDSAVSVTFSGDVETPTCFLPLYKSGDFYASVMVSINVSDENGSASQDMDIRIDGEMTATGFLSCRQYQQHIGAYVAGQVVGQVNQYLRQH